MSRLWFTSDTHFGHENLITKMGRTAFATIEEHDAAVLAAINSRVGWNDRLVHLGDFAWHGAVGAYRMKIQCKHILFVIGNHDKALKCKNTFGEIPDMREIKLSNGIAAICTHYPMAYWNKSHHGSYNLYGHCHAQREAALDAIWPDRRALDVGVDNALRLLGHPGPFSEQDVIDLIGNRPGHDDVAFYEAFKAAKRVGPTSSVTKRPEEETGR